MDDMTWDEACDRLGAVIALPDGEERDARMQVYASAPGVLGQAARKYLLVLARVVASADRGEAS